MVVFKRFYRLGVASFAYNVHLVRLDPTATFYSPATRIWELLAGVLLAYLQGTTNMPGSLSQRQLQRCLHPRRCTAGFWALPESTKVAPILALGRLLPILGSFCLIFAGPTAWFNRLVLSNRLLVWVGLISFPLYLWHWPILSFMRIVESEAPAPYFRNLAVLASFILAWMTYFFVEKPIRSGERNALKIVVLTSLVAALGVAGWVIYQNNGIPSTASRKTDGVNAWDNYDVCSTMQAHHQWPQP